MSGSSSSSAVVISWRAEGAVVAAVAAEDLDVPRLRQRVDDAARAVDAGRGREHVLDDGDLAALGQIGCHLAAHLLPDLIIVAADKAGPAPGVHIRVDRHHADPGGNGLFRCLGAAVVVRGGEDHDVRLFRRGLSDQLDLFVDCGLGRRCPDRQLHAVFLRAFRTPERSMPQNSATSVSVFRTSVTRSAAAPPRSRRGPAAGRDTARRLQLI